MKEKLNGIKRKTGRPLKSLLKPIHPKTRPCSFKNKIEENRYLFLQYLEKQYNIQKIKPSLWQGTALHLLELTHKISPDMHRAANYYLELSQRILQEGPYQPTSKFTPSLRKTPIPFSDRTHDPKKELEMEQRWWDLSNILEEEKVRAIINKLGDDRELLTLQHLIETETALVQLQKGLMRLQTYLANIRI